MGSGGMTNDRSKESDLFLWEREAGVTWFGFFCRGWGDLRLFRTEWLRQIHDTKDPDRHIERLWREGIFVRRRYAKRTYASVFSEDRCSV